MPNANEATLAVVSAEVFENEHRTIEDQLGVFEIETSFLERPVAFRGVERYHDRKGPAFDQPMYPSM